MLTIWIHKQVKTNLLGKNASWEFKWISHSRQPFYMRLIPKNSLLSLSNSFLRSFHERSFSIYSVLDVCQNILISRHSFPTWHLKFEIDGEPVRSKRKGELVESDKSFGWRDRWQRLCRPYADTGNMRLRVGKKQARVGKGNRHILYLNSYGNKLTLKFSLYNPQPNV